MIKFHEQVPSIYTSASRDFQYLSWLIDIVLNSVKHDVDELYNIPNAKADSRIAELMAMTLGFKIKRNYDQRQLAALVAVLPRILKYKGTITAIEIAGNALVASAGAIGIFKVEEGYQKTGELVVRIPETLIDVSLFTDLLPYILPAGMSCRIIRTNLIPLNHTTELAYQDTMIADWEADYNWDREKHFSTGLSNMYEVGISDPIFANYYFDTDRNIALNVGLLDNSIIPDVLSPQNRPVETEEAKEN